MTRDVRRCDAGVTALVVMLCLLAARAESQTAGGERRLLYVGVPGSDAGLVERPPSLLVFAIDGDHQFLKRIVLANTEAERVTGVAADVARRRLYVSTQDRLIALDLISERLFWEQTYAGGCCERFDLSPDGSTIYAPASGAPRWQVIDTRDGSLITTIDVQGFPRQTLYSPDGSRAFLGAWQSPLILVADTKSHRVIGEVGPFGGSVCPFAINGRGTLVFANVDGLVGFDVADLQNGSVLDRVIVEGGDTDAWAQYECASHGIALTRDERELWVADGVANRLHVFDATAYPPVFSRTIALQAQPRWVRFGADGRYAYTSTGDVIDTVSKKIVAALVDERGATVHSEAMIDVQIGKEGK